MKIEGDTIEEMWDRNQGWKWEIFAPYLAQEYLKLIESFELKEDPELANLLYCKVETNEFF